MSTKIEDNCHICVLYAIISTVALVILPQVVGPWLSIHLKPIDPRSAIGLFIGNLYGCIRMRWFISK